MPETTRILAEFAREARWDDLPDAVRGEAVRALVNYIGCALGGSGHDAVERTLRTVLPFAGGEPVTVIGRAQRLGALDAALVNCQASAAHAYDDTHLATVLHPAGPVAAPLLAEAERRTVSGRDFLTALAVGVEVSCRVAKALVAPPAEAQVGWYTTCVVSPVGAAAAVARLLGLGAAESVHALGLGAVQAAGFRQTHGSMCTSLSPGLASRAGYLAALLAGEGTTSSSAAIEGPRGFADVFAPSAHLAHATDGLGRDWEMLANMAKPYPCGIVIHPVLDACLEIARTPGFDAGAVATVDLGVHPLCLTLTDRPAPPDSQRAQVSVQHWAAAALVRAAAGIPEGSEAAVADPAIQAVRGRVTARPDGSVAPDGAVVCVTMRDGGVHERRIAHGVGSLERRMTDAELDAKFMTQAVLAISESRAVELLALCRAAAASEDVAAVVRSAC